MDTLFTVSAESYDTLLQVLDQSAHDLPTLRATAARPSPFDDEVSE